MTRMNLIMLQKKDFNLYRYFMIFAILGYILISIVIEIVYQGRAVRDTSNYIVSGVTLLFLLMVIFIDPDHHRIMGVPLFRTKNLQDILIDKSISQDHQYL